MSPRYLCWQEQKDNMRQFLFATVYCIDIPSLGIVFSLQFFFT